MPYVKLDTGMLDSSIWIERDQREIFITALLMAKPFLVEENMPQIEIHSNEPTSWDVPPGEYGFVEAAGPGIARRAGMSWETGSEALHALGSADPQSRSPAFDGRRMVRVPGGFIILNYMNYRAKDGTAADRQRRYRERKKEEAKAAAIARAKAVA